jgi:hypothetical protein
VENEAWSIESPWEREASTQCPSAANSFRSEDDMVIWPPAQTLQRASLLESRERCRLGSSAEAEAETEAIGSGAPVLWEASALAADISFAQEAGSGVAVLDTGNVSTMSFDYAQAYSDTNLDLVGDDMEYPQEAIWHPPSMRKQPSVPESMKLRGEYPYGSLTSLRTPPSVGPSDTGGRLPPNRPVTGRVQRSPRNASVAEAVQGIETDAGYGGARAASSENVPARSRGSREAHPAVRRDARSGEVQALQAEVAMQEVQLRRLLTTVNGDQVISDEVAFEAARLWQGLEGIRSVITTLQERVGNEASKLCEDAQSHHADDIGGFVEDAYVSKTAKTGVRLLGRQAGGGSSSAHGAVGRCSINNDGFDEIARLEAASAADARQSHSHPDRDDAKTARTVRRGAFRGLVRGSGLGGGASSRAGLVGPSQPQRRSNYAGNQERPVTPLKRSTAASGSSRRFGAAPGATAAPDTPRRSAPSTGGASTTGRKASPVRAGRSISTPRSARPAAASANHNASPLKREPAAGRDTRAAKASASGSCSAKRLASPAKRPPSPRSPRGTPGGSAGASHHRQPTSLR